MRPVLEGVLTMTELHSERLGLMDVALLNDALDVRNENERRAYERNQRK
jgi:hypothetical protein